MQSKQGLSIQKNALDVATAGETHAADIARGVTAQLVPYLQPGELMPDFELAVRLMVRAVLQSSSVALSADAAHEDELSDDAAPRVKRDGAFATLQARLTSLRPSIVGNYGPAAARLAGFEGALPYDPMALAEFGLSVSRRLPKLESLEPLEDVIIDFAKVSAGVEKQANELKAALVEVKTEGREAETTLVKKHAEAERHSVVFRGTASTIEGLANLAGMFEISDRVRPSRTRKNQTERDAAQPAEDLPPAQVG